MIKFVTFIALIFGFATSHALTLEKFNKRPKLVVVMVIDQFRADYLTKYHDEFTSDGFNFLMKKGSYFPFAEYDVLECMTCPGHAMIATGSHPYFTGISLNDWYDLKNKKKTYCVEDAEFGDSPRSLRTTTFGDELKNISEKSKVVTVALKDRAAIMLGGHRADIAIWLDQDKFVWQTSGYYSKDKSIPAWAQNVNAELGKRGLQKKENREQSIKDMISPKGAEWTREIAEAALKGENLGKNGRTDILTMSFSAHDFAGHTYGPNSPEMKTMTLAEDKEISKLITTIKKHMGGSLNDVVIALTADHGVAPSVEFAQAAKLDSGRIDSLAMYKKINERLDQKFGKPTKEWISAGFSFNYYLNQDALKERKVSSEAAQAEVKSVMKTIPGVADVATRAEIEKGLLPPGELGKQLARQYVPENNGDIVLIPKPFYISKSEALVNHMTGYAYDRTVPLVIYGAHFKPGVYSGAKVIDLAPTLTFVMGALPPATATGRVLSEIIE